MKKINGGIKQTIFNLFKDQIMNICSKHTPINFQKQEFEVIKCQSTVKCSGESSPLQYYCEKHDLLKEVSKYIKVEIVDIYDKLAHEKVKHAHLSIKILKEK